MITRYQEPIVEYLLVLEVEHVDNTVSVYNEENVVAGIILFHDGLFRLRKPCAQSLHDRFHDFIIVRQF